MREYNVTIIGTQPLLMHQDNIDWADFMDEWKNDPENKQKSKPGDDRTPAWRWIGCVYHDGKQIGIPSANIMRSLMEGGAMVPTGKGQKTFKAQTQSGMTSIDMLWVVTTVHGDTIEWSDIEGMKKQELFTDQKRDAASLGFSLLVKRARVGMKKHIRVRPEFAAGWQLHGKIAVWDDQITTDVLRSIFIYAGRYKGLGDWRPGGKTPGPYGMFEAEIEVV